MNLRTDRAVCQGSGSGTAIFENNIGKGKIAKLLFKCYIDAWHELIFAYKEVNLRIKRNFTILI